MTKSIISKLIKSGFCWDEERSVWHRSTYIDKGKGAPYFYHEDIYGPITEEKLEIQNEIYQKEKEI